MKYVMLVEIDDEIMFGDDSIEIAANAVNFYLATPLIHVRPLSEEIAC